MKRLEQLVPIKVAYREGDDQLYVNRYTGEEIAWENIKMIHSPPLTVMFTGMIITPLGRVQVPEKANAYIEGERHVLKRNSGEVCSLSYCTII